MFQTEFLGHLHPLIVHVPIGILLFAFAMMLFQRFRRVEMASAIDFALLLGALSATVACVAGWFLAQSGEYDADLVFKHQWTGIATAVLGFGAYFLKSFRWLSVATTVGVLAVAGHYGGILTHGEGYLFAKKKTTASPRESSQASKRDTNTLISDSIQTGNNQLVTARVDATKGAENAVKTASEPQTATSVNVVPTVQKSFVYRDVIVPILENKCYSCHSEIKKKGGLRLDSEAFINEGSKQGSVLTAGNPDKSPLYTSLILPEDDDDHMPPKGKPQLTESEIAQIHAWIKRGAPFSEITETIGASSTQTASTVVEKMPKGTSTSRLKSETIDPKSVVRTIELPDNRLRVANAEAMILEKKIEPATPSVLAALKQKNVIVSNFGEGANYVMANFVNVKNYNSTLIDDLKSIDNQLVRVKLSNLPVTDADVRKLATFKNITRLNLDKTNITDAGLTHLKNLPNLEQLNLYGTNITDKGLLALAQCPNLKVVYLWQTQATAAGIAQLKKALPNLQVEMGGFKFEKPDTNKLKNTEGGK